MATELSRAREQAGTGGLQWPEQVCGEQLPLGACDTAEPCPDARLPWGNGLRNKRKASSALPATDPSWDPRRGRVRQARK